MDVLSQVLNPDAYLDALETKVHVLEELPRWLRIARLTVALREDDLALADELLVLLRRQSLVGYEAFQLATASMWVAARRNNAAGFDKALNTWLYGRRAHPSNWRSEVLDAPEFAPFLANVDPERLVPPPPPKPKAITKVEREFVADLVESRLCAVEDNLHWLREMGITNLVVALDNDGNYTSSFIAH
jgi:hypothetical protein